jgi:hypothetical protein
MNDYTTQVREQLRLLSDKDLSKQFYQELRLRAEEPVRYSPYTEDETTFLVSVSIFIKLVGHADFGKMLRVGLYYKTGETSTHEFHKALRQVDAFSLGEGLADSLLHTLLELPQAKAFWEVFTQFFFPLTPRHRALQPVRR